MKIGIIGCGLIGKKRADCLNKNQIKIASDANSSKLTIFKKNFNCEITKN
jgi:predicted dehydrogenase